MTSANLFPKKKRLCFPWPHTRSLCPRQPESDAAGVLKVDDVLLSVEDSRIGNDGRSSPPPSFVTRARGSDEWEHVSELPRSSDEPNNNYHYHLSSS